MPKKARGGRMNRTFKQELVTKEDGQEYGTVTKMLGDCRVEVDVNGKNLIAMIRGTMKKKVWITTGDTVLVSKRDFQDDKVDLIHKYQPDDVRKLKSMGEIKVTTQNTEVEQDNGINIDFDNETTNIAFDDL